MPNHPVRTVVARLAQAAALSALVLAASTGIASPFPAEIELSSLLPGNGGDGSEGFVLSGIRANDETGGSVAAAGDVNGDGVDDLVAGGRMASFRAGETYVVYGSLTGFPAQLSLADLLPANGGDGSRGFVVRGIDQTDAGTAVAGMGDVDGDGYSDLVIGAPNANPHHRPDAGQSYVLFGRADFSALFELSSLLAPGGNGTEGFTLDGIRPCFNGVCDDTGAAVSVIGDANADGYADVLVGAPTANPADPIEHAGRAFLVFGHAAPFMPELDLSQLLPANGGDGTQGAVYEGYRRSMNLGGAVSGAGDLNADGIDDFIMGAPHDNDGHGGAYVIFGRNSGFPAQFSVDELLPGLGGDGSEGVVLDNSLGALGGYSVARLGDLNGDGVDDVLIGGSPNRAPPPVPTSYTFVVFGRGNGFPPVFDLGALMPDNGGDGTEGFVLLGDATEFFLSDSAGAGDVNGDGINDIVVGANFADPGGIQTAGRCYVVFGRTDGFPAAFELVDLLAANGGDGSEGFVVNGTGGKACEAVRGGADLNGDGVDDLIIGAPQSHVAGEVFVLFGRAAAPDSDRDGVPDDADNCSLIVNPDQRDTNADGFGNICDADLDDNCLVAGNDWLIMRDALGTNDPHADLDGNGIVARQDVLIFFNARFQPPGPSGVPNGCDS